MEMVGMEIKVLQRTQTIVRYQNQNGQVSYGIIEDGEILQLTSTFNEIINNELKM
jgi:hypothetical protein